MNIFEPAVGPRPPRKDSDSNKKAVKPISNDEYYRFFKGMFPAEVQSSCEQSPCEAKMPSEAELLKFMPGMA